MTTRTQTRLARTWSDIRWSYSQAAAASPRLFRLYWLNTMVSVVFPAGIALSIRGLVNTVSAGLDAGQLDTSITVLWLLLGCGMTLGSALSFAANAYLGRRFELELRPLLSEQILQQQSLASYAQFEQQTFRDGLARAQDAPELAVGQLCAFSLELVAKVLQGLSLVVILLAIEPLLFVLLLPLGIPYLIFQWRLSRRQFDEVDKLVRSQRRMNYFRGLLSSLEQFGEIKVLGLGPELRRRYASIIGEFRDLKLRSHNLEYSGKALFSVLSICAVYVAMGFAALHIVDGALTIGDLAIFGSAAGQLRSLVEHSVKLIASSRWQLLHVRRVREFLEQPMASVDPVPEVLEVTSGDIVFRAVSFAYPDIPTNVISNMDLKIAAGEMVALVGRNGAGKTTVAMLLAGFYRPDAGEILIGGSDTHHWNQESFGKVISMIPQHFGRYAVSAGDNIAFGDWQRLRNDKEAVAEIARKAGVDELIQSMPDGYDTVLGRDFGAHQLSGGQWQQLAIARMMARDTPILVLDEPTASLDVEAEAELFQNLKRLASGRTTLLISHRFSSVSMADRILVVDEGRIIESGTHQQLLQDSGHYASLFRLANAQFTRA
ncbi:MAG: ABC transporter ATP-binding protein [Haliea sp.]|nr:ABC transporter ATP-binding protein [Haliea sp.]MBK6740409.1 ABC transporter ATP-binding protein [Haliea sp.]